MSEETVASVVAEILPETQAPESAPDAATTAVAADSPVAGEGDKPETQETKPKTFTQEDVDKIVSKEKARVERKLQRDIDRRIEEALQKAKPAAPDPDAPQKPKPDQFATTEEYVEAISAYKAEEIVRTREQENEKQRRESQHRQYHEQVLTTFRERESAAMDKYEDFQEVAYNPDLPITNAMAATIQESDMGPEIAYHLGKNPQEAVRIAKLSPFLQAKELGKLEAKIASAPPPAKPTAAPAPIAPIRNANVSTGFIDTSDPKSAERLSTSEWINAERKRQMAKWEREHR